MSRSQWKFDYFGNDFLEAKKEIFKENLAPTEFILQNRSTHITKELLNLNIKLYNGMRYFSFTIENDMLGHCLGEFAPTKKKATRKKKIKKKKN